MISNDNRPGHDAKRRLQAEAAVRTNAAQSPQNPESLWPQAAQEVLHELRVHQIELEMQNEELQQAQQKLDAARARYFDLYDQAPVGYCSVDATGLIVQANLAATTLLGTTREALLRQPITRFLLAEAQEGYYLLRKRLIQTGEPQSCELRMARIDGTPFWAHLETTVTQGADGAQEQRIALSDNPERERMLRDLTESEDRFRAFMGALPAAAFIMDQDSTALYANRYMEDVLGARTWIGKTARELFPPEMAEKMIADDRLIARSGVVCVEEKIPGADGRLRIYQTHKFSIPRRGQTSLIGGISLDITERKNAEIALQQSEVRWKFAVDGVGAGVIDWDIGSGAMHFSDRWLELAGFSRGELAPRLESLTALVHPEDLPGAMAGIQEVLEGKTAVHSVEHRLRHKQGRWLWIQARSVVCAWSERGEPLRMIGTHIDISARKQLEMDLSKSVEFERQGLQGELRRVRDRLGAITSNVPGMVFELTQCGEEYRFTYVSPGARELFGFAAEGLPRTLETLFSLIHEEDSESFLQSLERSAQTFSLWSWVGQVTGPQGELRWVQLRATPRASGDAALLWEGIATDVTAAKASELALNDTRQLLRVVSTNRESVREEERIRIARELHDELGQVLTGMKLHLSAMALRIAPGEDALKTQAAYVMHQIDQAIAMTRSTVLNLRPPALDQGLGAAIAWLADQFTQRSGIVCSVNLPVSEIALDELHAIALFRLLQEALTNIIRHSGASQAGIDLRECDGRLHLQVIDDGKGFLQTNVVAGRNFGLLGMRERVAMLGGRFEITGTEGVGTTIDIEVALEGGAA